MKIFPMHIIFWVIFAIIDNLSAMTTMTQIARKSPAVTRTALVAGRTGIVRTGIIAENAGLVRARWMLSLPKNQVPKPAYNRAFKQEQTKRFVQNPKVIAALLGTAAVGLAVIVEAEEVIFEAGALVHTAYKLFNPIIFDEDLISEEFSQAIVKTYSKGSSGTGFIVRSEHHQDLYFVVTAAHCIKDEAKSLIALYYPGIHYLYSVPIIVDNARDVAVLLILLEEIKEFKHTTGKDLPGIPASQLSNIRPQKKEEVALQGYPASSFGNMYKKKFISQGPGNLLNTPGEKLFALNAPDLTGASGSPLIAVRNNQPQVLGVLSVQGRDVVTRGNKFLKTADVLAAGVGELPDYIQRAEKIQKVKEEVNRFEKNKTTEAQSWSDYFKRYFGGK